MSLKRKKAVGGNPSHPDCLRKRALIRLVRAPIRKSVARKAVVAVVAVGAGGAGGAPDLDAWKSEIAPYRAALGDEHLRPTWAAYISSGSEHVLTRDYFCGFHGRRRLAPAAPPISLIACWTRLIHVGITSWPSPSRHSIKKSILINLRMQRLASAWVATRCLYGI
jgi:hypothetical protein